MFIWSKKSKNICVKLIKNWPRIIQFNSFRNYNGEFLFWSKWDNSKYWSDLENKVSEMKPYLIPPPPTLLTFKDPDKQKIEHFQNNYCMRFVFQKNRLIETLLLSTNTGTTFVFFRKMKYDF